MTYSLLDSGDGQKFEQFGDYSLIRPCPQAIWRPKIKWDADGEFVKGWKGNLPDHWIAEIEGIQFKIVPSEGGAIGVFPEHAIFWKEARKCKLLNLFAYTGGASIAFAKKGATVCHLDASKSAVAWAKENAALNGVESIRWIVDDAMKFLSREVKRGSRYDLILLDPPSFGRETQGEVFKLEKDLPEMLQLCGQLSQEIILSCHTTGMTSAHLKKVVLKIFPSARVESGSLLLFGCYVKIYL